MAICEWIELPCLSVAYASLWMISLSSLTLLECGVLVKD